MIDFDLTATRARIAELNARKRQLQQSTFQRDEARELLAAQVDRAGAEGAERLARMVRYGEASELMKARWWSLTGHLDLLPLLAGLFGPDKIKAALAPHIKALPPSMPAEERAALLADLDAELWELEDAEESHLLQLEAIGQKPARRGDASPAVVLRLRD